jgi:hypothetical protein
MLNLEIGTDGFRRIFTTKIGLITIFVEVIKFFIKTLAWRDE